MEEASKSTIDTQQKKASAALNIGGLLLAASASAEYLQVAVKVLGRPWLPGRWAVHDVFSIVLESLC